MSPFAGFETFDKCVAKQKSVGHNDESAHRICGYLQSKAEGTYHGGKGRSKKKKK